MADRRDRAPIGHRESAAALRKSWTVFAVSATLVIAFSAFGLAFSGRLEAALEELQEQIAESAGWLYIVTVNSALGLVAFLLLGRHGTVRIGGAEAEPEFSRASWLAMLFAAGMGVGLFFNGVYEPLSMYRAPAWGEGQTIDAAQLAMGYTFLHWGLHPWSVYGLVGLAMAYFVDNRGLPLAVRSAVEPLAGHRIWGPIGSAIDVTAVVATLFGVSTALGLGAQQLNAGLAELWGLSTSPAVQVGIIAVITAVATTSVVVGLSGGIRRLSFAALGVGLVLLLLIFVMGPTSLLLRSLVQNVGYYIDHLPRLSTWAATYQGSEFSKKWTLSYWAWWISWSPFVGIFIARISRGRTVREFLLGVLLVPSLASMVWFTVIGGTALKMEMAGGAGLLEAVELGDATSLFTFLDRLPLSGLTTMLAVLGIALFFVTSSDSGSLVVDIITSGGNPEPHRATRIFWAVLEGIVAAVLLLGGGLQALRSAVLTVGLPFSVVLLVLGVALVRGLDVAEDGEGERQTGNTKSP